MEKGTEGIFFDHPKPRYREISVRDEKFVESMISDFNKNRGDWENQDIPSFLEAISAWVEGMDGFYTNQGKEVPEDINWKVFTDIFYAARIYE